jgi:hypothetical protein
MKDKICPFRLSESDMENLEKIEKATKLTRSQALRAALALTAQYANIIPPEIIDSQLPKTPRHRKKALAR